mmetsp:Transcript_11213/g.18646  ORF Transcript_11213/g.18646 Transcript_11213/m.18646 type:complete len:168 (+) Transcript_11213:49-552(+)
MKTNHCFNAQIVALLLSLLIAAASGFEFAAPNDCIDVCDGVFAFHSKEEAEACCRLTRSLTDNTFAPTAAPTPMGTENMRDDSRGGDPGTTASCRNLGGPSDTSVRVRYGEYLDQCLLCVGPTIAGDECGAPDVGSTSDAAARTGRWYVGALVMASSLAVVAGTIGY